MASDYRQICASLSKTLTAQATDLGVFANPSGKGDGREDLVRRFLSDRIGSSFGVAKCEIIDSLGNTSSEQDVALFDHGVMASLHVSGERRIVRAESVAMVIEVKSTLSTSTADEEKTRMDRIAALRRRYSPAPLLRVLSANAPQVAEQVAALQMNGLGGRESLDEIPPIVTGYFAYDGPTSLAVLEDFARRSDLNVVCILGKATLMRPWSGANPDYTRWGSGDEALGAFVDCVRLALESFRDGRALATPAGAYHQPSNAVG